MSSDEERFNSIRTQFRLKDGNDDNAEQLTLADFLSLSEQEQDGLVGRVKSYPDKAFLRRLANERLKLGQGQQKVVFRVKASIRSCRQYKGYRSSLYLCAQKCEAFYLENKEASIRHEGNDLLVDLLFESKKDAHSFQNALLDFKESRFGGREMIFVDEDVIELLISPAIKLQRVFHFHYDTSISDSPPCLTLADIASISSNGSSEVEVGVNPEHFMRSLENLDLLTPETSLYRCQLASKAQYPAFKHDENNIIFASWDFHNHFDGLHNSSKEPEIAVMFEGCGDEEDVVVNQQVFRRRKVIVQIEYRKEHIAAYMARKLKAGSEVLSPLLHRSFLFVKDAEKTQQFLQIKYEETTSIWMDTL